MDWRETRKLFPAAREVTYLNTATYGPGPLPVMRAVLEATRDWSSGKGDWRVWEGAAEDSRQLFAQLLETGPETIALLPSLSVAAGQVAESLPFRERANIVVSALEFRSNLFPWLSQERRGFELRIVPGCHGRLDAGEIARAVDSHTTLVAVSSVQSSNGYRIDLDALRSTCRSQGARLFVDATQSVGALRERVEDVDYMAVSAYKWICAPRGATFLHVAPERIAEMPPIFSGWKSPQDPHASYYGPPLELAADASRYDVSLAWSVWVGVRAALELTLALGIDAIQARDLELARRFRAGLGRLGLEALFEERESSQIVGLKIPDPEGVRRTLAEARVIAAVRGSYLRASFHFFNDESDVDRGLEVLSTALGASPRI